MALPGHRRTSSHKRRRASHFALTASAVQHCPKCDKPLRPHRACLFCGYYKGRQVVKKQVAAKKTGATKAVTKPAKRAKKTPASPSA